MVSLEPALARALSETPGRPPVQDGRRERSQVAAAHRQLYQRLLAERRHLDG